MSRYIIHFPQEYQNHGQMNVNQFEEYLDDYFETHDDPNKQSKKYDLPEMLNRRVYIKNIPYDTSVNEL